MLNVTTSSIIPSLSILNILKRGGGGGGDSPAEVARCLMAQWFGGSSSRDYRAQESIFALSSAVKPFIQNTIKRNKS